MTQPAAGSKTVLGVSFVLLSAVGLATQNVILRLFFTPSLVFDQISLGGVALAQAQ